VKQYSILLCIGVGVIVTIGIIFGADFVKFSVTTQDHAIFVDPLLDEQGMFTMGRVTIQNIGAKPITNLHINFGDGDILDIQTLKVGQKIIVSPPPENSMEFVMISADNDIFVNKAYREMPKMVGMMGS
jgi:hypothetical protein